MKDDWLFVVGCVLFIIAVGIAIGIMVEKYNYGWNNPTPTFQEICVAHGFTIRHYDPFGIGDECVEIENGIIVEEYVFSNGMLKRV